MRGDPRDYQVHAPRSLPEALSLLASNGSALRPLAGGTDIMVLLEMGLLRPQKLMSLHAIPGLADIRQDGDYLRIGAGATFTRIRSDALIGEEFPMLSEAASLLGALAIQNRATIGGNIANASPAADSSPALLAYDAEVELVSLRGPRRIAYADFHTGYKKLDLRNDELISAILLPRKWNGTHQQFRKVGARAAQAITKVSFAGVLRLDGEMIFESRIAMGSVGPVPLRCRAVESELRGKNLEFATIGRAKEVLIREITPIDDIRSNREYRLRVSLNLLEDFLFSAKR